MNASVSIQIQRLRPSWLASSLRPCRLTNIGSTISFTGILANEPWRLYSSGPNCGRVVTASLATDAPPPRHLNSYSGPFWWGSNHYRSSSDVVYWRCAAAAVAMAATAAATLCATHTTSDNESTSPWFHVRRNSGLRSAKITTESTMQCCGIVGLVGGGVSEESDSNIPPLDTRYVTSDA
jgi:hypothetical protein